MSKNRKNTTVFLVEESLPYQKFLNYFSLSEDDLSEPRVVETESNEKNVTLVSYSVDGVEGYEDARLDFRVFDSSNEFQKAEVVLTDYDDDGKITDTKTYTIRHGDVVEAVYDE